MPLARPARPAPLLCSAAAVTLMLAALPVRAGNVPAPTPIVFTGQLANASTAQAVGGGTQFDFWSVDLDPFTSFTVSPNQSFVATVSLDGAYTLPASVGGRFIRLFLQGPDLASSGNTSTQGSLDLLLGNTPVVSFPVQGCLTSAAVAACSSLAAPHDTALTFDRAVFSFTIDVLDHSRTASVAVFDTVLTTPVPEAHTWALLTAGLGGLGLLLARRRSAG